MKLLELTTAGLRVPDRTYSLHGPNGSAQPVTLLTGPPGSGKTSLLYCIAAAKEGVAPYGAPVDVRPLLRAGRTEGSLRALWQLTDEELARTGLPDRQQSTELLIGEGNLERKGERPMRELLSSHGRDRGIGKLELFPQYRRLGTERWRLRQPPLAASVENGRRLGTDADKYHVLARVLHDVATARTEEPKALRETDGEASPTSARDALGPYRDAVSTMVPGLGLVSVTALEGSVSVAFVRADGTRVGIAELPANEEQGVLFALVYAWLGLDHSIWLVDSPESCLPTELHADFLARLTRLGTDNQLIVATGSEALVRAARPSQLIDVRGTDPRAVIDAARSGETAAIAHKAVLPTAPSGIAGPASPAAGGSDEGRVGGLPAVASPPMTAAPPLAVEQSVDTPRPPASGRADAPARRLGSSPWARQVPPPGPFSLGSSAPAECSEPFAAAAVASQVASPAPPPASLPVTPSMSSTPFVPIAGSPAGAETARAQAADAIGQTQEVRLEVLLGAKPVGPFEGSASAPPPVVESTPAPAHVGEKSGQPVPAVGETKEVSLDAVLAAAEAVPFSPKPRPTASAPALTLEQYASYCAEMTASPDDRSKTMAKYGIASPAARVALSVHWGKRFEDAPELKARFDQLEQDFVAWLRAQPR